MTQIPEGIRRLLELSACETDRVGMSESSVLLFPDRVLKISPAGEEAENEYRAMSWLQGKLPVPQVIRREMWEGRDYLLMSRLPGVMCCDSSVLDRPDQAVKLLAQGLRLLWQVDIRECPFRWDLDRKLRMARYNVEHGLVDVAKVEPTTFGRDGFRDPYQLLEWLEKNRPKEEPVFSHGDYCLPNLFVRDGQISGFLDLGKAGCADRYQDIALCYRSLSHNCSGVYGRVYEGSDPELLFGELGIVPDREKLRYYILLDELF